MGVVGTPPRAYICRSAAHYRATTERILKHPGQTLGNLQVKPCKTLRDGSMLLYTHACRPLGIELPVYITDTPHSSQEVR